MSYKPIQCQIYDYIEIACMHGYQLKIKLNSGEVIEGSAINTNIINKEEYLVIALTNKNTQEIRLDKIQQITALNEHASFKTININ